MQMRMSTSIKVDTSGEEEEEEEEDEEEEAASVTIQFIPSNE
jgi:hypothetical protein